MSLRIAVLGGGIMGVTLAIRLARRGVAVALFESESALMQGASRYNEGKIHLGCLYSASGSLSTANRVLTGGLRFFSELKELLEHGISQWVTPGHDHYLVHRDSVVDADQVYGYMRAVADLVDAHPDRNRYPGAPCRSDFHKLELADVPTPVGPSVTACLRVPERSVATQPVADTLVARAEEQPNLEIICGTKVLRANVVADRVDVETSVGTVGGFDYVINALWHGRPQVDKQSIGRCDAQPHHRYRVSLFIEEGPELEIPSAVVAAGPFGDFKNYGGGRGYVSWYPAGLLAESTEVQPCDVAPPVGTEAAVRATALKKGLASCLPALEDIDLSACRSAVAGGWVYAQGGGSLGDPHSSLHRRDRLGVYAEGPYLSIDTGKYSTAPYLASAVETMLLD